jgi:hypothetical protein
MSDAPPPEPTKNATKMDAAAERAVAKAEAAATRRRWVNLAEVVAVAGVIIAALTLWNNWSERRDEEAARKAEQAQEAHAAAIVSLVATPVDGGAALSLEDPAHRIQSMDFTFPAGLDIPVHNAVVETRIEADWFADKLLDLTDGGPDEIEGRLPVLITSEYWSGDQHRTDAAIYDIVWQTEGRLLRGRTLRLKGVVLRARTNSPARLNALWKQEKPSSG